MKKLITGGVILALALSGAPQAAAFSSGSSGSNVIQPQPQPEPEKPSQAEVYTALNLGYETSLEYQGYTWSSPASDLMRIYAQTATDLKPYYLADLQAKGYSVNVVSHVNANFKTDYDALMATPKQPKNYALYGTYVEYGPEITKVYILTTQIPS